MPSFDRKSTLLRRRPSWRPSKQRSSSGLLEPCWHLRHWRSPLRSSCT